jgi:hypothetical protein
LIAVSSALSFSHDIAWTFDHAGIQSYVLESFEPNEPNLGPVGPEDPTLTLHIGKRYQVTIIDSGIHPFEVIAKGGTSSGDTVLLSMKGTLDPIFESDPNIAWTGDGTDTVTFTLTLQLYNAMQGDETQDPGYRCGIHSANMRGNFNICTEQIPGDFNGDCHVSYKDLLKLTLFWLDFDVAVDIAPTVEPDGIVDFSDFALMAVRWLDCSLDPAEACWQ